jgi:hypothetical protein
VFEATLDIFHFCVLDIFYQNLPLTHIVVES